MAESTNKLEDADKQNNENSVVKVAKVGMWQAIFVALITTVGGIFIGYLSGHNKPENDGKKEKQVLVVPIQNTNKVKVLPTESNSDLYQLVKDVSIFDLRQWKQTPDSLKNTRYSPCNYTNYLHVKKTKPLEKIVIHYATSGFGIDMRCITNSYDFVQKEKPTIHGGQNVKEYALIVNVSVLPLNKEFLIVVEATYWNGFSNLSEEDASTYTDGEIHGLDELGLIVFFPESKPFKEYQFLDQPNNKQEDGYRGESAFYGDKGKKFIYWSIRERLPNHHYRLKWTW